VRNRFFVILFAGVLWGFFGLTPIQTYLREKTLDTFFQWRGPIDPGQDVIIIAVDEASLDKYGAWPWSRCLHAKLLEKINTAKVAGLDFLFPEYTSCDETLSHALASGPPTVLAVAKNSFGNIIRPAKTIKNYSGLGHIDVRLGSSGVVRRAILQYEPDVPCFALAMLKVAGVRLPYSPKKNEPLINYYGPGNSFVRISYSDVLDNKIPLSFFKDKFVLVGVDALGLGDAYVTPFSSVRPTPGIEVQATILQNLKDKAFLNEPNPLLCIALALVFSLLPLFVWPATIESLNLLINSAVVLVTILVSYWWFSHGWFFDPNPGIVFLFLAYLIHLIFQGVWMTRRISGLLKDLDQEISKGLSISGNPGILSIPEASSRRSQGNVSLMKKLQESIKVMGLQRHFIENFLRQDMPPLILWELPTGKPVLASKLFRELWKNCVNKESLPNILEFKQALEDYCNNEIDGLDVLFSACIKDGVKNNIPVSMKLYGRNRYFTVAIQLVKAPDVPFKGLLAIFSDITEVKEIEKLKDEVVSIMSHELKLPLTSILGYGEMLTSTLQGKPKFYASEICFQANRLNRLIVDFLDVTRIERGKVELRPMPVDLVEMIHEAVDAVALPAKEKSITIEVKGPQFVTPIKADGPLLLQALINLLDNAVKFSPENGKVTISITEQKDRFLIQVEDQGPGIPPAHRERVFDKFFQGENASSRNGFGLGLSFVKQVVAAHKGDIKVHEGRGGKGALFILSIPKNGK